MVAAPAVQLERRLNCGHQISKRGQSGGVATNPCANVENGRATFWEVAQQVVMDVLEASA